MIELKNIYFTYNKKSGKNFCLNNISTKIREGDFITLLGPNGSGKSTLLKILSGYFKPESGTIKFNSKPYQNIPVKSLSKEIAVVSQKNISIFPFSIHEIVMMGRTPYLNMFGVEDSEDRKIVNEALKIMKIYHLKDKGINEVSGGEAQRAFIARALAQKPKYLLLDEPNAHLDVHHQFAIFDLLKDLNDKENITVVAVSHDLNLSLRYSKKAILLDDGKIAAEGLPTEILTGKNIDSVFKVSSDFVLTKSGSKTIIVNSTSI